MTLVEVLAAITILSIVLIGVFSIFPQMTDTNVQMEDKLETMNVARKKLEQIKSSPNLLCNYGNNHDGFGNPEVITYYDTEGEFRYEIDYFAKNALDFSEKHYVDCDGENPGNTKESMEPVILNEIHIKVYKKNKLISETFGYIKH